MCYPGINPPWAKFFLRKDLLACFLILEEGKMEEKRKNLNFIFCVRGVAV